MALVVAGLVGVALTMVGLALFLWPSVTAWRAQREMSGRIEAALTREADAPGGVGPATGRRSKEGDPAYEFLAAYNQAVAQGSGGGINDPFGLGSNEQELAAVGLGDAIVGAVSVPAMNVRIPLYLGATDAHMERGAAVIAGTSAPLGGQGSNCAIAAHRGEWYGVPMFRDIESVAVGDVVVIETPWDVLVYRAVELRIIEPTDVQSVAVQPGRDLVTLFTCHPYGHNYQRYLVVCERDVEAERAYLAGEGSVRSEVAGATTPASILVSDVMRVAEPCESRELRAERVLRVVGLGLVVAMTLALLRVVAHGLARRRS